jgi:hypothetical protein
MESYRFEFDGIEYTCLGLTPEAKKWVRIFPDDTQKPVFLGVQVSESCPPSISGIYDLNVTTYQASLAPTVVPDGHVVFVHGESRYMVERTALDAFAMIPRGDLFTLELKDPARSGVVAQVSREIEYLTASPANS